MKRLVERRGKGYADLADLWRRTGLSAGALDRAGARRRLRLARPVAPRRPVARSGLDRTGHEPTCRPVRLGRRRPRRPSPRSRLPPMTLGEQVVEDYADLRMSLRAHPLALLRPLARAAHAPAAARLAALGNGRRVEVAGLVLVRQRPGTASGVIFVTLEDETGIANLVVWPSVFERFRRVVMGAQLLACGASCSARGW